METTTDHSAFEHKIHGWPRGLSNSLLWHRLLSQDNYSAAQLVRDRPNLLFCGCFTTHTLGNSGRVQKAKSLEKNGFRCTAHCKRGEGNEAAFQYKFVVSMRGNSAQNYRDWEALLAGAIPLVDYNAAHEPMWEGMPVVQIRKLGRRDRALPGDHLGKNARPALLMEEALLSLLAGSPSQHD